MDVDTESGMRILCDAVEASSKVRSEHQCRICHRFYERSDHLNRHLQTHENRRLHKCNLCQKRFNRADLLSRHVASHDRTPSDRKRIERAERVAAACAGCVAAKVKCQDHKPCARCVKKNISCEPNASQSYVARTPVKQQNILEPSLNGEATNALEDHNGQIDPRLSSTSMTDTTILGNDHSSQNFLLISNDAAEFDQMQLMPEPEANYFTPQPYNNFSLLPGDPTYGFPFASGNFPQLEDPNFNLWDIDFDTVELAYQAHNDDNTPTASTEQTQDSGRRASKAARRHAAFERSPWLFKPTSQDHVLNDSASLNLDEENISTVLSPCNDPVDLASFSKCYIGSKARDQLLSIVFSMRRAPSRSLSFPSLELLNSIIRVFFVQESYSHNPLLHFGTFNPGETLPELVMSVIAAGSIYISTPAVWKMGIALQDMQRHAIADFWEQNNSNIRNLQAAQAFFICLEIGLWSGFKRQMEIAESFAQPVVIMIRRSGAFGAQKTMASTDTEPRPTDSGSLLHSKWKRWTEAESWKRLILHLFFHDNHASIGMQKPPLIYITEFKFQLPASRNLWLAQTAEDWRDLWQAQSPRPSHLSCFQEVRNDIDLLESFSGHTDLDLCVLTVLHGYWGQIWAFRQSCRFYTDPSSAHRLALMTEYRELYSDLSEFSQRIPSLIRKHQVATLLSELFMMLLHTDPDELQKFVGKYGEQEARQASAAFKTWSQTDDARKAIWHAGQVYRAARQLSTASLRGFNAIAVYYATLTLWIYGLMSTPSSFHGHETSRNELRSSASSTSDLLTSSASTVKLNEPKNSSSRMFIKSGKGIPGIMVSCDANGSEFRFVPLSASDEILLAAGNLYRGNFPDLGEPLPPLVENLGNLLRDLRSLPGSRASRACSEV